MLRAQQSDQSDHDQVDRDNEIQQARYDKNQDAGDQGNQRSEGEVDIHLVFPFSSKMGRKLR
jgi:hypothetical protein